MDTKTPYINHEPLLAAHNAIPWGMRRRVANKLDITYAHYIEVIHGRDQASIRTLAQICAALNVPLKDVVNLSAL